MLVEKMVKVSNQARKGERKQQKTTQLQGHTVPEHGGPAGGNDPARPAPAHGGRGVDAAGPVREGEPLVGAVAGLAVHYHGGTYIALVIQLLK